MVFGGVSKRPVGRRDICPCGHLYDSAELPFVLCDLCKSLRCDAKSSLRRLYTGLHGHSCFVGRSCRFWHRIYLSAVGRDSVLPCPDYLWSYGAASLQSSSGHSLRFCDGCHGRGDDGILLSSFILSGLLPSGVLPLLLWRSLLRLGDRQRLWP